MRKLCLLLLLAGCAPNRQEQAIVDFMRGPASRERHLMQGYLPGSYEPLAVSAPRKCYRYHLFDDSYAMTPKDTCQVGTHLVHYYRMTTKRGEVKLDSARLAILYSGEVRFFGH
jgi:hypothetical protein